MTPFSYFAAALLYVYSFSSQFTTPPPLTSSSKHFIKTQFADSDAALLNVQAVCNGGVQFVSLTICNLEGDALPVETPVTFYDDDPTTEPANVMATLELGEMLEADSCRTLAFLVNVPMGAPVYAVINDAGTTPTPFDLQTDFPNSGISEVDYTNNIGNFEFNYTPPVLDLGPDSVFTCTFEPFTLDAGDGFNSYLWQNGSSEQTFTAVSPGLYWVEVTDSCGGVQQDTILLSFDPGPTLEIGVDFVELCEGESVTFSLSGFDVYSWGPSDYLDCDTCATVTSTPAESITYYVTGFTQEGCVSVDSMHIEVLPVAHTAESILACTGSTIFIFGNPVTTPGVYAETFAGENGCDSTHTVTLVMADTLLTGETLTICEGDSVEIFGNFESTAGEYSETYTAQGGCDSIHTVTLVALANSHTEETLEICEGESVEIFGNFENTAGDYSESYTAANGCDSTHVVTLVVLPSSLTEETLTICQGDSIEIFGNFESVAGEYSESYTAANGCDSTHIITLVVNETSLTLETITISQGDSVEIFGNFENTAGDYSMTFTNTGGCDSTHIVTLVILDTIFTFETIEICAGDSVEIFGNFESTAGDYSMTFTSSGGIDSTHTVTLVVNDPVFTDETIEICQGDSIEIFGNFENAAGDYTMIITGSNGCDSTHTVTLVLLETPLTSETIQICFGDSVEIFGNFESVAGEYSMVFTAANGCDSTHVVTLEVRDEIVVNLTAQDACFGESNGAVSAVVSGGAGNFTYEWSTGSTDDSISDLAPGTYELTVTDDDGCAAVASAEVGEFDEIAIDITVNDISCFDGSNGNASAAISGGTGGPFTYEWSTGSTDDSVSGLSAGSYSLTVTDEGSGCTATAGFTADEPSQLSATTIGTNASCADNDGTATVNATGGTTPYSYSWSNNGSGQTITGLSAGTYTATVTDDNGCTTTASVTIQGAPGPVVTINVTNPISSINANDGALTAQISGGTAPVQVEWSNGATTTSITGLSSGNYSVTVTDANGCTAEASVTLTVAGCIGDRIWNDMNRDGCQDPGEFGMGGVKLTLTGTDIFGNSVTKMTNTSITGQYKFNGLAPGTYQVTIQTPANFSHSPANACVDDFKDSDFSVAGVSPNITITEGQCNITVDGGLYNSCNNISNPGTICCDQTLCGPGVDPAPITPAVPASGGIGTIQYIWFFSHDSPTFNNGTWTLIQGATGAGYDPGPISQTTYYARCAKIAGCTQWLESNIVTITVGNVAVADISGPDLVCVGKMGTYTAAANPPGATYSWNFGPWATPSTSNQPTVNVTWNQAGIVYVTLTVTRNGCVSTDVLGVAISNSPIICPNNLTVPNGEMQPWGMQSNAQFLVYPNPANDYFVLQYNDEVRTSVTMEILSMDGRLLSSEKLGEGTYSHTINSGGLLPGAYLLRLTYNEGERRLLRFIKN